MQSNLHEDALLAGLSALGDGPVLSRATGDVGEKLVIFVDGHGRVDVDGAGGELEDLFVVNLLEVPLGKRWPSQQWCFLGGVCLWNWVGA